MKTHHVPVLGFLSILALLEGACTSASTVLRVEDAGGGDATHEVEDVRDADAAHEGEDVRDADVTPGGEDVRDADATPGGEDVRDAGPPYRAGDAD
ncbi:MAG: hypothetical protein ACK6CU_03450 [Deltaproteobacteria bacterium]